MTAKIDNYTLTIIDTSGIQGYIFNSNLLRHNIGASGLVAWATQDVVYETLVKLDGPTNVNKRGHLNGASIEKDSIISELMYAGGGNTFLLFDNSQSDHHLAKRFTEQLTYKVLKEAPGLQLVISHIDLVWSEDVLADKVDELIQQLQTKKGQRRISTPLLGLGVTQQCNFTGQPATCIEGKNDENLIDLALSSEQKKKHHFMGKADEMLKSHMGERLRGKKYLYNFDDLGTKGESSYMAVVHIDGNGMGKRVEAVAGAYREPREGNREYIEAMRAFSDSITTASKNALQATGNLLAEKYGIHLEGDRLPFRPIVFGGDDVTFVCEGWLGLPLAQFYLSELEKQKLADQPEPKPLYARAGVAVVHSHYPFSRAYQLAEELAKSAKGFIQAQATADSGSPPYSAIDWHFAVSGLVRSLDEIREREYCYRSEHGAQPLNMRPLIISGTPQQEGWRTWTNFSAIIGKFQTDEQWVGHHNKLKALMAVLRDGPDATLQFTTAYGELPQITGDDTQTAEIEWMDGGRCPYFDALEALDFFDALNKADNPQEKKED